MQTQQTTTNKQSFFWIRKPINKHNKRQHTRRVLFLDSLKKAHNHNKRQHTRRVSYGPQKTTHKHSKRPHTRRACHGSKKEHTNKTKESTQRELFMDPVLSCIVLGCCFLWIHAKTAHKHNTKQLTRRLFHGSIKNNIQTQQKTAHKNSFLWTHKLQHTNTTKDSTQGKLFMYLWGKNKPKNNKRQHTRRFLWIHTYI